MEADNYPGFMAAEGNIYSCRYGISFKTSEEFNPRKEQVFSALLAKNVPGIESHVVILRRFDVYVNNRLAHLRAAGTAVGGFVGNAIAESDNVNAKIFTFNNLIVDPDPLNTQPKPKEHIVGCDFQKEGEYYASQISGGHAVVVTWLNFDIDQKPYTFKTYYQFQHDNLAGKRHPVETAVNMTFEAIAPRLEIKK